MTEWWLVFWLHYVRWLLLSLVSDEIASGVHRFFIMSDGFCCHWSVMKLCPVSSEFFPIMSGDFAQEKADLGCLDFSKETWHKYHWLTAVSMIECHDCHVCHFAIVATSKNRRSVRGKFRDSTHISFDVRAMWENPDTKKQKIHGHPSQSVWILAGCAMMCQLPDSKISKI